MDENNGTYNVVLTKRPMTEADYEFYLSLPLPESMTKNMTLGEYIRTLEHFTKQYEELMALLPECPQHGKNCLPHAIEWIKTVRGIDE